MCSLAPDASGRRRRVEAVRHGPTRGSTDHMIEGGIQGGIGRLIEGGIEGAPVHDTPA